VALATADSLRVLRHLLLLAVVVCAGMGSVVFVIAGPATAGLKPDPPKPPQRAPRPPASSTPLPDRAPPPPAPQPVPIAPATPKTAPPAPARRTTKAPAATPARAAKAQAPRRRVRTKHASSTHVSKTVATRPRTRRPSSVAYTFSNDGSKTAAFVAFALPVLALGLLLLGAALIPADALPWQELARVLNERRDDLAFTGLAILGASAVWFLLIVMA
jgi:hypothetical protein